ncbi:MAG: arsenite methyltransferase [Sulfurimonas sp.]|jgi:arsenite methyltransferase|uniref:methyltransferase domain-containing protein n=1 Tax=Sulfurimonas sp. TaxID=2022749 RepID=UPI0039E22AAC
MTDNTQIIELYTELAQNPNKDFGWDKGLENALAHGYKQEWIEKIPSKVWEFCAAVGNPFKDAEINKGDTVLDLGCGAGLDALVASLLVGESGEVVGVDITPKMVEIATDHAKEMKAKNVKILQSSFDAINVEDESVDVVISNGAINLTSCKESVFTEIYRVLKPNGKIFFADMIDISIDEGSCCLVEQASCCDSGEEDWANCVAGTMRESELIELIQKAGFKDVKCTGHNHYTTAQTTKGATFIATKIPAQELREKHWNSLFQRVDYTQVLWHQTSPQKSLELIKKYTKSHANIIDVGCGASHLVDNLLECGYKNITLLDTSKYSLDIVQSRVSNDNIRCECNDILNFKTDKKFDIWHDRAVFHFLLSKKERIKYFEILNDSLKDEGIAIISTFKVDGPTQCAGLDIVQYNHASMLSQLTDEFELIESEDYLHITPKHTQQKYIYFIIKKR